MLSLIEPQLVLTVFSESRDLLTDGLSLPFNLDEDAFSKKQNFLMIQNHGENNKKENNKLKST